MNLAIRDIRHNAGRFAFTSVGIGLLLMIVMGMGGIYRGLIHEATLLVDRVGADLWIVQGSTRGPFAEISRIPANLEDRVRAVPGVAQARRFVSHTIQREHAGRPLRMVVQGLSWTEDRGDWVPLVAGRPLRQAHYEMIADQSLKLPLGSRIRLGKDVYQVVGLTRGMVGTGGDGLTFFTVSDAMAIQFDQPGEATRLDRAARRARVEAVDLGRLQPLLLDRAAGLAKGIPALAPPQVSAVLVTLRPGADAATVRRTLGTWPDITVYSTGGMEDLLLAGMVDKAKRQLGLFRVLLIIISTIIIALIIYTLTLEVNDTAPKTARKRAMELLDYLGIGARAGNLPVALSGGEQQRVAVARALANNPSLILADEPTAALDGPLGRQVMELFAKIAHEKNAGVIVVTHDHRTLDVFDRILDVEDGMIKIREEPEPGKRRQ